MNYLKQKRILLGVTGGIAAYKSAELVRALKKRDCEVQVIMTRAATEFVKPLTFQALSGNPVHLDLLDPAAEAAMGHIQLARWADAILIAPCSANTLTSLAQGNAKDLLTTTCLASNAPLAIAPAMNRVMWSNINTQENIEKLKQRGVLILGPADGAQACGEFGAGRMFEPEELVTGLETLFSNSLLAGLHVLITAGPTRELIDPVRFISNFSSGKMGFAIATAAQEAGAAVTIISGPVHLPTPNGVTRIDVESADDMFKAVMQQSSTADIFIAAAAVADYKVAAPATQKIKKSTDTLSLTLERNPDILATVANQASPPFTVGFAAETENLEQHAKQKLCDKKLNMIVANPVGPHTDTGFDSDNNILKIFWNEKNKTEQVFFPKNSKTKLARDLIKLVHTRFSASSSTLKSGKPHEKIN